MSKDASKKARQALGLPSLKSLGIEESQTADSAADWHLSERPARADNPIAAVLVFPIAGPGLFILMTAFHPFAIIGGLLFGVPIGLATAVVYMGLVRIALKLSNEEIRVGASFLLGIVSSLISCFFLLLIFGSTHKYHREAAIAVAMAGAFSGVVMGYYFPIGNAHATKQKAP